MIYLSEKDRNPPPPRVWLEHERTGGMHTNGPTHYRPCCSCGWRSDKPMNYQTEILLGDIEVHAIDCLEARAAIDALAQPKRHRIDKVFVIAEGWHECPCNGGYLTSIRWGRAFSNGYGDKVMCHCTEDVRENKR